jgi:signal transduction histidine kinase
MAGSAMSNKIPKSFNLLRWFSIASLMAILPVGGITAFTLSQIITEDNLQRDAWQTAQFIQNCIEVESRRAGLGANLNFARFLDERIDTAGSGISQEVIKAGRQEIAAHLSTLPDVLLATLFALDGRVVWSTNPALLGKLADDNDEFEKALNAKVLVAKHHASNKAERGEQVFSVEPKEFFIEYYFPIQDSSGKVVMVAEVYKEPRYLLEAIERGQYLIWGTTFLAGALVYLGLFSIIRRASVLLEEQQRQLVETESLVFIGEMATAIAHGLRNPLANIRSSAELASTTEDEMVRKYAHHITSQVDFLSKWLRELLVFSQPVAGEREAVDLTGVVGNVLDSFAAQCATAGISLKRDWDESVRPSVQGNTALVVQVVQSVVANAVEAMQQGGELRVTMRQEGKSRVRLVIGDTGTGMSEKQLALAFKPFHSTKRNGLGLGLPMVKRIVERFEGEVELSSQEGKGTEVRLVFKPA